MPLEPLPWLDLNDWYRRGPYNIATVDLTQQPQNGLQALQTQRAAMPPDPLDSIAAAQRDMFAFDPAEALGGGGDERDMFDETGMPPFDPVALDEGGGEEGDLYSQLADRIAGSRERLEAALADRQDAAGRSRSGLEAMRSRINYGDPWLAFAGAVMQPAKSGSPMESIGKGISALNSGLNNVSQQEMAVDQAIAHADSKEAQAALADAMGLEGFDLKALDQQARLKAIREKLDMQRERMAMEQDHAMAQEERAGPLEKQLFEWVQAAPDDQERRKREAYVTTVRGTSQMKNAEQLGGGNENSDTLANLITMPAFQGYVKQAEKMIPQAAFQGQPAEAYTQAVQDKAKELFAASRMGAGALTGRRGQPQVPTMEDGVPEVEGASAPVPAQETLDRAAAAEAAQRAPVQQAQRQEAAAPQMRAAEESSVTPEQKITEPWRNYIRQPTKMGPTTPSGSIPIKAEQAGQVESAKEAEKFGQKYFSETVQPGAEAAQQTVHDATVAEELLRKHPSLTGAGAPYYQAASNWLSWMGYGVPDKIKNYAGDAATFNSLVMNEVLTKQLPQKGPQTESDAKRMMDAGLRIKDPVEKNMFVVRSMKASALRAQEQAQFFSQWQQANKGSLREAREAWSKYTKETPLVRVTKNGKFAFFNEERDFRLKRAREAGELE